MRGMVAVLAFVGCVRDAPAPTPVAACASCEAQTEPHLGMSNSTRVGDCRYEVRRGTACCLVRWDVEPPRGHESPHKTVALEQLDGGFAVEVCSTIIERTFHPSAVALCPGERLDVCGETIECAP